MGAPTAAAAVGGAGCGRAGSWASSALLVVLILVFTGVMYFYLNSKLTRANALVNYAAGRSRAPGRTGSSPAMTAARG